MKLKNWLEQNWMIVVISMVFVVLAVLDTRQTGRALIIGGTTFLSIAGVLVSVYIFIGLFSVWVKEDQVMRHFGEDSGWKGMFYGAILGTVFHGPAVSIFPLLKSLKDKGARMAIIVVIVSAFAIKIPVIPLELSLFGWKFTLIHNGLLFVTALPLGLVMERLLRSRNEQKER